MISIRNKKKKHGSSLPDIAAAQTAAPKREYEHLGRFPSPALNTDFYAALYRSVPIIGAGIEKLCRLLGSFEVRTGNGETDGELKSFFKTVRVGAGGRGIDSFILAHFRQLLLFGTAVSEIIPGSEGGIDGLYNASLKNVARSGDPSSLGLKIAARNGSGGFTDVSFPELVIVSTLNPEPGEAYGVSILEGLPFVSEILGKIFGAIGQNWDRVGNVRYCVTYRPQGETDGAFSQSRAKKIAEEWSKTMTPGEKVSDFIAVGDVEIKAIGADNQILSSEVPVRQMLEQIVAKLGVPPFLLGLSWSSTERMSSQQADILTSEIEFYRRLLDPAIEKIARLFLALNGKSDEFEVVWDDITLQDIETLARTELLRAQTEKIRGGL